MTNIFECKLRNVLFLVLSIRNWLRRYIFGIRTYCPLTSFVFGKYIGSYLNDFFFFKHTFDGLFFLSWQSFCNFYWRVWTHKAEIAEPLAWESKCCGSYCKLAFFIKERDNIFKLSMWWHEAHNFHLRYLFMWWYFWRSIKSLLASTLLFSICILICWCSEH